MIGATKNSLKTDRVKTIHFIGIGGTGMCGIAEVLLQEGYHITGSDLSENQATKRLKDLGANIVQGHQEDNVNGANVVVRSTAVSDDNPEIIAARLARIPVVGRAEMLAELMRFRYGIAVAGTHGKTTTTSLVASLLSDGGLDPSYIIGGLLNSRGSNAHLGGNHYLVAEADESDASFLHLKPMVSVVTNIDADHMETYGNDFNVLRETFLSFIHHLPFYGLAVLCIDNDVVRELIPEIARPYTTYGFHEEADVQACDFNQVGTCSEFTVVFTKQKIEQRISLNLPGKHNVQNALAAIAIAVDLGIDLQTIADSLAKFKGIGRRFHQLGEMKVAEKTITLIDDYGHHPRELAATIEAARGAWPERRLVMMFQPHRYTRTRDCFDDFAHELSQLDLLLMLNVYSAGEAEIPGANSRALCRSVRQRSTIDPILIADNDELSSLLENVLEDGDILILQGAGSVGKIAQQLKEQYVHG